MVNKTKRALENLSKTQSVAAQQLFPTGTIIAYAKVLSSILVKKLSKILYQFKYGNGRLKNNSVVINGSAYTVFTAVAAYSLVER